MKKFSTPLICFKYSEVCSNIKMYHDLASFGVLHYPIPFQLDRLFLPDAPMEGGITAPKDVHILVPQNINILPYVAKEALQR